MDFILRPLRQSDNPTLARMIRAVFHEFEAPQCGTVYSDPTTDDLFALFQTKHSVLWVAEVEGNAVGCCGVYPTPALPYGVAELVKFYLGADYRDRGIGKALFNKSIESARDLGYKQLYLESLPQFSTAVDMYFREGFSVIDSPLGISGHSTCNIWMLKTL